MFRDRFEVKQSWLGKESKKTDDNKHLKVPEKKQNGGKSAVSPEVHSVASLLKRHSSGYARRKVG